MERRTEAGEAPGLKRRPRANGTVAQYWVASSVSRDAADYQQKTVRLHGDDATVAHLCRTLTSDLREWLSQRGRGPVPIFTGSVKSLIEVYRKTPESPYHAVKHNTRVMYDESLDLLERTVGDRQLSKLTGLDFKRWYDNLRKPAEYSAEEVDAAAKTDKTLEPKPERIRRAYKAMQLVRIIMKFGVVADIKECVRLALVLENMRFESPAARIEQITFEQVQAFCAKAVEMDRLSLAIAQALEFELTLRQVDVIGQWEPADAEDGGIVDRGKRWSGGALWSHIDERGILEKKTTKRGQIATHDTTAYPYLVSILDHVQADKRIGPMVKDEGSGLPYRYRHYARCWRKVATAAGIPLNVWNRDTRAGGVTEGSDAGADIEHLRHHATHANIATTGRYNRRTVEKTRKVAELRVAHRGVGTRGH
jgi:hypothetical protein